MSNKTVECVVLPGKVITQLVSPRGYRKLEEGDEITLKERQFRAFRDKVRLKSEAADVEDPFADPFAEVDATESAKILALEAKIDLASVKGTGSGDKILKADVEKLVKKMGKE